MTVAQTILEQLGNRKFITMTGAKNLMNHGDALSFKLPNNFAAQKINSVKISYNEQTDLYKIEFNRIYGTKFTEIKTHDDIYCDMLRDVFTKETGLDVSF